MPLRPAEAICGAQEIPETGILPDGNAALRVCPHAVARLNVVGLIELGNRLQNAVAAKLVGRMNVMVARYSRICRVVVDAQVFATARKSLSRFGFDFCFAAVRMHCIAPRSATFSEIVSTPLHETPGQTSCPSYQFATCRHFCWNAA